VKVGGGVMLTFSAVAKERNISSVLKFNWFNYGIVIRKLNIFSAVYSFVLSLFTVTFDIPVFYTLQTE
jgi:hypothetical protein